MSARTIFAFSAAAVLAGLAAAAPASARGGGNSSAGDAFINDAQKNPRFIEPGADFLPSRYRASNPSEGYDDRQAAAAYRRGYRGQVIVRPYGY